MGAAGALQRRILPRIAQGGGLSGAPNPGLGDWGGLGGGWGPQGCPQKTWWLSLQEIVFRG